MKKVILALLAGMFLIPVTQAVEVVCPANWQAQYGCSQCFQFYLTDADQGFTSQDQFIPRGTLENGQKEILWLDQTTINAYEMQNADIGPTGNVKNLFSFPSSAGTHNSNGENHAVYQKDQTNIWAQMQGGNGFGINSFGSGINPDEPIFRVEYVTKSQVETAAGDLLPDTMKTHKECAMYMYAGLNAAAEPSIEISVKNNQDGSYEFIVTNTGDVAVSNVQVQHSLFPQCNAQYDLLIPGMSRSKICTLGDFDGRDNIIQAEGRDPNGNPVRDEHRHGDTGGGINGGKLLITVKPLSGTGVISGETGIGASYLITVKNIGTGPLENVSINTAPLNCNKNYDLLPAGASDEYVCNTGNTPGPHTAKGRGYTPGGKLVTYQTTFGGVGAGCSLKTDKTFGGAPLTVQASIICSSPSLLAGKKIYIQRANGEPITSYDSYGHAHTFTQPGEYIISCLPLNNPASQSCQQRIQVTLSCGNGVVEVGEQCDDGNQASGDGCSNICYQEMCGNGVIDAGEQCDDGNNTNNDQCSNICRKGTPNAGPGDTIILLLAMSISGVAGGILIRRRYT